MTEQERDDVVGRAVSALGQRRTFRKDGRTIELAFLAREQDWRPLKASWWRGKEVSIIGADLAGNFFLRHCDGTVRYWHHADQTDIVVAKSVSDFVQHIGY